MVNVCKNVQQTLQIDLFKDGPVQTIMDHSKAISKQLRISHMKRAFM